MTSCISLLEEFILTRQCKNFIFQHIGGKNTAEQTQELAISIYKSSDKSTTTKWITIDDIILYQSDKDVLLKNEWLNDKHIHVAQTLIKQQFQDIDGLNFASQYKIFPWRLPPDFAHRWESLDDYIYV